MIALYLGGRNWGLLNILIEFDHTVVQSWKIAKDKELLTELGRLDQNSPTLNLSSPITMGVKKSLWESRRTSERRADLGAIRSNTRVWEDSK